MQIQQNSCLQPLLRHVMWLQPWFFSMRPEHLGHGLVLAMSHVMEPASLRDFSSHLAICARAEERGWRWW
jgi:hypothetical protein